MSWPEWVMVAGWFMFGFYIGPTLYRLLNNVAVFVRYRRQDAKDQRSKLQQ